PALPALGGARLLEPLVLPRGGQGRALRGVGRAAALRVGDALGVQVVAVDQCRTVDGAPDGRVIHHLSNLQRRECKWTCASRRLPKTPRSPPVLIPDADQTFSRTFSHFVPNSRIVQ